MAEVGHHALFECGEKLWHCERGKRVRLLVPREYGHACDIEDEFAFVHKFAPQVVQKLRYVFDGLGGSPINLDALADFTCR